MPVPVVGVVVVPVAGVVAVVGVAGVVVVPVAGVVAVVGVAGVVGGGSVDAVCVATDAAGGAGVLGRTVGSLSDWVRPVTGGCAAGVGVVVVVGVVAVVSVWAGAVFTALVSVTFLCAACPATALPRTDERGSA